MPIKSIRTVFIGLFFVLIDISVLGVDVLPDVIGYAVLFVCLTLLTEGTRRFALGRNLSLLLLFLSASALFGIVHNSKILQLFAIVSIFLDILMAHSVLSGLAELASACENRPMAKRLDNAFLAYVPVGLMEMAGMLFSELRLFCLIAGMCFALYVLNTVFLSYRTVRVPLPEPEPSAMPATRTEYVKSQE